MKNIFLQMKINKQFKEFKQFKANFNFKPLDLIEKDDSLFVGDVCIREKKDGEMIGETENFVNVGYKIHGATPKLLSNLFPYKFYFRGFWVQSIESVFQCLKFKNKKMQKLVFSYSGLNSNNIKMAGDYNWKDTGIVYFQGKAIDRNSKQYENFVDELYICAIQNPLYRNAIKNVGSKYILHAIGETNKGLTLFSREEFERELNCLKDFVILKNR